MDKTQRLVDRFIKYTRIHSASKEDVSGKFPSTDEQLKIGEVLLADLKEMGLQDATQDKYGYVFATLPGNLPAGSKAPVIGLLAHVDTYPGTSGKDVKPILHKNYDGQDIILPGDQTQIIRASENPDLGKFKGQTIITSDGTTLLGADDKAGIAEIMEAVQRLMEEPLRPRPTIRIGFTPDEEVGNGTAHFDLKAFGADFAYTADGSSAEEVEDETFSADSATVMIQGHDVHPGYAKGKMVNALDLAARLIRSIPAEIRPENADGRQGYLHPVGIEGSVAEAKVSWIVRDFEVAGLKKLERQLAELASSIEKEFPRSRFSVEIKESYRNMKEGLDKNPAVVRRAMQAVERVGLKPKLTSIRGGTDGSRLTAMGLLTPNLCGGGKNFHSKQEWISVSTLENCTQVLIELVGLWAK